MAHECGRDGLPAFGYSCCYAHLKALLRAGARLPPEELDFVGYYEPRPSTGGWRPAWSTEITPDEAVLSAEDSETLHALMAIEAVDLGRDRLRFLGG